MYGQWVPNIYQMSGIKTFVLVQSPGVEDLESCPLVGALIVHRFLVPPDGIYLRLSRYIFIIC